MVIGLLAGVACWFGAVKLKRWLKVDDSLDAFGVHGMGGIVGALLTGVFADAAINGAAEGATILKQAIGLIAVIAWSAVGTGLILLVCKFTTGLRVDREQEIEGLDSALHGETLH
jgi:Amt family ammonium transporter